MRYENTMEALIEKALREMEEKGETLPDSRYQKDEE